MLLLQTFIFDLLTTIWVGIVLVFVCLCLPSLIFALPNTMPWTSRIVAGWTRMLLVTLIGVGILSALHLFSWFTLVILYGSCFLLSWLYRHDWRVKQQYNLIFQGIAFVVLDALDQGFLPKIRQAVDGIGQIAKKQFLSIQKIIAIAITQNIMDVIILAVILTFAVLVRFEYPWQELRFTNPDSYSLLLTTRQILVGDGNAQMQSFPAFSALAAVLSLLGAIDAMQVIRFLSPLLGCLLVLSVGYSMGVIANSRIAVMGAMYSLGAYIFTSHIEIPDFAPNWIQQWLTTVTGSLNTSLIRQWAGGDLEIGVMCLVLGLGRAWEASRTKHRRIALIDTVCCLLIVAIIQPQLLILALFGGISFIGGGRFALTVVTIIWIVLALVLALPENTWGSANTFLVTLPVGLSWLWGLFLTLTSWLLSLILGLWSEIVCLILMLAIAINFLLPLPPKISYLEYDMAARKTLELRFRFPLKRWVIVAPIEQLAESYGAGWYEDMGLFVEKYSSLVSKPNFHFRYSVPNLFIFVEKRPLVTGLRASQSLPYSVLSDPTYLYYRSSAGRASLEFTMLQMCETYRRLHEQDVAIYYEDQDLRIYQVRLPEEL